MNTREMQTRSLIRLLANGVGNPFAKDMIYDMFNRYLHQGDGEEQIFDKFGRSVLDILWQIKACLNDPAKPIFPVEKEIRHNIIYYLKQMNKQETLRRRIERCEDALRKEQERQHSVLNSQGWGYGMTHTRIGVSDRRENELKSRLAKLRTELASLTISN